MYAEEHRTAQRQVATHLQFYLYPVTVRKELSSIDYGYKLFQQYLVDAYVKVEVSRMDYLCQYQASLRIDLYRVLIDHVQKQNAAQSLPLGKVVPPSSYAGSPWAMQHNYHDAMAIYL